MLDMILAMDSLVDTVPLLLNRREAKFIGVTLYVDDRGSAKGLPLNVRASDIASQCGKPMQVLGDAFIGRMYDNDDDLKRLDFTLKDLDSSASWIKKAREMNKQLAAAASRGESGKGERKMTGEREKSCNYVDCAAPASSRCSRCKKVFYCSKEHQVADWKAHKRQCAA